MNEAANLIRAIGSLWPLLLLGVIVWYRRPIGVALGALGVGLRLRRVKAGPFEAEFWKEAYETRSSLDRPTAEPPTAEESVGPTSLIGKYGDLAMVAPAAAMLQAHTEVAEALRRRLIESGDQLGGRGKVLSAAALARRAFERELIPANVVPAVEGITALRNLAAHGGDEVTREQAGEYLALADGVMFALKQAWGKASR